uniref:Amino acid transporter transmembrane domain-containing protein n=1 Tax=Aegilops tauschii TaxID=37682 RepID=M8AQU7_AEGTA
MLPGARIGSGVLSLPWSVAQLGLVAGPATLVVFAGVMYYTSVLLTDSYHSDGAVAGKRNYTYIKAVESYTITAKRISKWRSVVLRPLPVRQSCRNRNRANCFHNSGHSVDCGVYTTMYMVLFAISKVVFSQLPNLHEMAWLSILAAVMSISYSTIGVGLSLAQTISGPISKTTMGGTVIGVDVASSDQKIWLTLQALGNIAFAYSYSMVLIEIQDTVCLGYATFGNMLTRFGFSEPFWLIDFANICIVVHLAGIYQVYCKQIYATVESWAVARCPGLDFIVRQNHPFGAHKFGVSKFRLVWRTVFVVVSTVLAILLPFFNDILGLLGALGFWPLTVYFPVEMHIRQRKVKRSSWKWVALQGLSFMCFAVTVGVTLASVQGITQSLKSYVLFKTKL